MQLWHMILPACRLAAPLMMPLQRPVVIMRVVANNGILIAPTYLERTFEIQGQRFGIRHFGH
jgi:hypothetical protein